MEFDGMIDWVFRYEDKDLVIGIYEIRKNILFIWHISLKQHNLDRKGLGTAAYNQLESYAKSKGIKYIYGELEDDTYDSNIFWTKKGFGVIQKNQPEWKDKINLLNKLFAKPNEPFEKDIIFKEI